MDPTGADKEIENPSHVGRLQSNRAALRVPQRQDGQWGRGGGRGWAGPVRKRREDGGVGLQWDSSLLFWHQVVDGLAGLQALLHVDQQVDAVHHHLDQLHLREAQAVRVGDVEDSAHRCGVNAAWDADRKSVVRTINMLITELLA